MRTSSTRSFRSCSATSRAIRSCSSGGICSDTHCLQHLLSIDRLHALPRLMASYLPLRRVLGGYPEQPHTTEFLRDGRDPVDQLGQCLTGRTHLTGCEVDQLPREPVADRTPEVFLDQAWWMVGD